MEPEDRITDISTIATRISTPILNSTITNKSAIYVDGINNQVSVNYPLEVAGRDVLKELDEIRDALLILKRDIDMEAKYPRLRELKDAYEQALEKYKTLERLK